MDEIYDDLDNYNDGNIIAELQTENKSLKSTLDQYECTLAKLQKDYDELMSQYKKLELNYSSLLKTAKSEIERKTDIIKNLNIEKDKMVLESFKNRYTTLNKYSNFKPKTAQNDSREHLKPERDVINTTKKHPSPCETDRTEKIKLPSNHEGKSKSIHNADLRNKLHSVSSTPHNDHKIEKHNTRTTNMPSKKDDTHKSSACITNRRKSMPAPGLQLDKISSDDESFSNERPKDLNRQNITVHHNFKEKSNSRTESGSSVDRHSGYEPTPNTRNSRTNRHDDDSYRTRSKSSHRHKRSSPERHNRQSKDYHDNRNHRSSYDKHRIDDIPPTDRPYNPRRSGERHNNYKGKHHEHEKLQNRRQDLYPHDRHPTKHKIPHTHEDIDRKRLKLDINNRQHKEQKFHNENDVLEKYISETFDDMPAYSCQSPECNYSDTTPTDQVKEIKLTAATKLEDPRTKHQKYVVQTNDGKEFLSRVEGRNIEIIPLEKAAWGIVPVNMPEALLNRPIIETDLNMHKDMVNPVSIEPTESSQVNNLLSSSDINHVKETEVTNILKQDTIKTTPGIVEQTKNSHAVKSTQNKCGYRIPKLKRLVEDRKNFKSTEMSTTILDNPVHENSIKKSSASSDNNIKTINNECDKQGEKIDTSTIQSEIQSQVSALTQNSEVNEKLGPATGKMVEDDLQLSDDTCDNTDDLKQDSKETIKPNEETKDNCKNKKDKNLASFSNNTIKENGDNLCSSNQHQKLSALLNKKVSTVEDSKIKPKCKIKSKHKSSKETGKGSVSPDNEKITRKKGKEPKTKPIDTKFSELFGDSNSLITPEDLGLTPAPAAALATRLPDKCVPFFEDALDAADLRQTEASKALPSSTKSLGKVDNPTDSSVNIASTNSQDNVQKKESIKLMIDEEQYDNIYKNMEPGVPEKPDDVIKTVIISSGVQPRLSMEDERDIVRRMEAMKHDILLKALATSTPHKMSLPYVETDSEVKLSDSVPSCSVSKTTDNIASFGNSDCNTLNSQTNIEDPPDVRIFVKRRRRVVKK